MHTIKMWIEDHPYIAGIAALGIIVLFIASRGSSSDGEAVSTGGGTVAVQQSGPSDSLAIAQLQASTALAAKQADAVSQTNLANAALAAKQLDAQTSVTVAGYARDIQFQNLSVSADVQKNANDFAYKTVLSNNDTALKLNTNNNATTLGLATIQSQQSSSFINSLLNAAFGNGSFGGGNAPLPARPISSMPMAPAALPALTNSRRR